MSKGSTRRPGVMPLGAWDRIFKPLGTPPLICPRCNEEACICEVTEDGPGQDEASKLPYERRRFNREGV